MTTYTVAVALADYDADPSAGPFAISDTAANVATGLDALQTLAAASELASIALTDGGTPTLIMTEEQLADDAAALGLTTGTFAIEISGSIGAAAAVDIPSALLGKLTFGLTVSDTAANIAANFDELQTLAVGGQVNTILFTDGGTPTLTISAAQFASESAALLLIRTAIQITTTGSIDAATAVGLTEFGYWVTLIGKLTAGLAISDTAANVVTYLDGLVHVAGIGGLGPITLTDGGTPNLSILATQFADDAVVLSEIVGTFTVTTTGTLGSLNAAAIPLTLLGKLTAGLVVADFVANLIPNLDAMQALAAGGGLAWIVLNDVGIPNLSITATQFANDATALGLIASTFTITATGLIGAAAAVGISSVLLDNSRRA